jgi:site-specific DNA-cytosine methylase
MSATKPRVLELFAGTGSVGKVCKTLDWEVISLDLVNADINIDIMKWDYKKAFPPGHFDIVWASPPCRTFSILRSSWIGRKLKEHNGKVCSAELIQQDMENIGIPILRRTQEIIEYFNPKIYVIENPQTGRMKHFLDLPYYDADYCKYTDWGYKKRTRFWTNADYLKQKPLLLCKKDCCNMDKEGKKHIGDVSKATTLNQRYRVPPALIQHIFTCSNIF